MRALRRRVRSAVAKLMRRIGVTAALVLLWPAVAFAATPAPAPTTPQRIDVQTLQPRSIFPKKPLHSEFTVEVNRLGQVTRVRTVKPSHDPLFDAHTYGNALQAFIRTTDGHVVLGTYRLTYDYDPVTLRVRRDVALVRVGGVNPNAKGAATEMIEIARRNGAKLHAAQASRTPAAAPSPAATINPRRMPDLPQIMHSPSH